MARIDLGLSEGATRAEERSLGEEKVHCMNTAGICSRIHVADGLVEQKEEKANETSEGIVCREALCALVAVVDEELEG